MCCVCVGGSRRVEAIHCSGLEPFLVLCLGPYAVPEIELAWLQASTCPPVLCLCTKTAALEQAVAMIQHFSAHSAKEVYKLTMLLEEATALSLCPYGADGREKRLIGYLQLFGGLPVFPISNTGNDS